MTSRNASPAAQWRVNARGQQRSGSAEDPQAAWHQAVAEVLVLAAETAGSEPLVVCVGAHDAITVFPALTDAGELDLEATRLVTTQLLSDIEVEFAAR